MDFEHGYYVVVLFLGTNNNLKSNPQSPMKSSDIELP